MTFLILNGFSVIQSTDYSKYLIYTKALILLKKAGRIVADCPEFVI